MGGGTDAGGWVEAQMQRVWVEAQAGVNIHCVTGNRYQDEWLKAIDLMPLASALRIATANKAGEYSGQLAKELHRGLHFMHE